LHQETKKQLTHLPARHERFAQITRPERDVLEGNVGDEESRGLPFPASSTGGITADPVLGCGTASSPWPHLRTLLPRAPACEEDEPHPDRRDQIERPRGTSGAVAISTSDHPVVVSNSDRPLSRRGSPGHRCLLDAAGTSLLRSDALSGERRERAGEAEAMPLLMSVLSRQFVLAPSANKTRMTADGGEGFEFDGMVFAVTEGNGSVARGLGSESFFEAGTGTLEHFVDVEGKTEGMLLLVSVREDERRIVRVRRLS
ncbi:hypothetical protein EJB05_47741, partial [Eragrostis curvula]